MANIYVDGQVEYTCGKCGAGNIHDYQGWMSGTKCEAEDESCGVCGHHTVMMEVMSNTAEGPVTPW